MIFNEFPPTIQLKTDLKQKIENKNINRDKTTKKYH